MTVECVTLATNHLFAGNALAAQHRLRYQAIIKRQGWDVPEYEEMEYDQYDNPASTYLIWRDHNLEARGVTRLYPTDRSFMLTENLSEFVDSDMPTGTYVMEGSRFCIDHRLDTQTRKRIANELVLAYLEYGLAHGISHIVGLMYPAYWKGLFYKNNWKPFWLGEPQKTDEGHVARAGYVIISEENRQLVRQATGINHNIMNYGDTIYERKKSTV